MLLLEAGWAFPAHFATMGWMSEMKTTAAAPQPVVDGFVMNDFTEFGQSDKEHDLPGKLKQAHQTWGEKVTQDFDQSQTVQL